MSAPATATAGSAFNVTVTLRDAFLNVATGYTGTAQFSSTDAQASLPGNYTFTAGDAGTHVFSATLATSGADFVQGRAWGALNGTLAVAALKGERVLFLRFGRQGGLKKVTTPPALRQYGRLRTVQHLAGGELLVATDGADGDGRILTVRPR